MPTPNEVREDVDLLVTNKTAPNSCAPADVGVAIKRVVSLVESTIEEIPAGPQGQQGPQGIPGAVGPAGLTWRGMWSANTSYVANDAVGFNGASYFNILSITENSSNANPVSDTTHWALLAAQGAQGVQGEQGVPGPQGQPGTNGDLGYTVLEGNITQTGTSAPTIVINKNTLGFTPLFGYTGVGKIAIALTGVNAAKHQIIISPRSFSSKIPIYTYSVSGTTINIQSYNLANNALENDMFINTPIEIRVYQ